MKELVYAATARCRCGAGLAYEKGAPVNGSWYCSRVLKGEATGSGHDAYPFIFWKIKSELQPSAFGASTRD